MNTLATIKQAAKDITEKQRKAGYQSAVLHQYTDVDGNILYVRLRMEAPSGEKWIRPLSCDSDGNWTQLKEPGFKNGKPLYQLHLLANNPDQVVFIVEGEKCADALIRLGLLATTSGGASSANDADWQILSRREVIIWADNDTAGIQYAHDVATKLTRINAKVKYVDIDALNLPPKGDCVDWLQQFKQTYGRNADPADIKALALKQDTLQSPTREGINEVDVSALEQTNDDAWLFPGSLLPSIDPSPYPIDALPNGIREAVKEVLEFTQCPPALAACSALSALSLAAQHLADVKRAEGLISPVSIYTLAVAESGERKTSVDRHFTSAISQWESHQAELLKDDIKRQYVNHQAWTMQFEGLKQKIKETAKKQNPTDVLTRQLHELKFDEPEAIRVPRLIYGDVTPEQLAFSLAKGWPSAGVLSSEAGIVFGSHGMSGDSAMRSMSQINVLWEGGKLNIDRRTSDSYSVQGARLTMGLAVQADTVKNFFDNSKQLARGTGFAARFLIAWPDSTQGSRLYKEPPKAWPNLTRFNQRITDLLDRLPTLNDAGGIAPKTLEFTHEAKKVWIDFHDEVERELKQDGAMSDLKDVASKAADNVARIAALFHLFEGRGTDNINAELVEAASDIVTWHLFEAKRFLQEIAIPSHIANAIKIDNYILRYCREHNTNVIQQNHIRKHGAIRDTKLLKDALNDLAEANRIRIVLEGRTHMVEVNPELLEVNRVK